MPGKRQFAAGGEDSYLVVRFGKRGTQQKGSFGQVGPAGEIGHLHIIERIGVVHHGQRIAEQSLIGKNIQLMEIKLPLHLPLNSWSVFGFLCGTPSAAEKKASGRIVRLCLLSVELCKAQASLL